VAADGVAVLGPEAELAAGAGPSAAAAGANDAITKPTVPIALMVVRIAFAFDPALRSPA
jgi:hypothetical protein